MNVWRQVGTSYLAERLPSECLYVSFTDANCNIVIIANTHDPGTRICFKNELALIAIWGSTKREGERRVERISVVCADVSIYGKGTVCVRVVSGISAFIKSAIAFFSSLRPTTASSSSARVAVHLSYGLSDFFFVCYTCTCLVFINMCCF